MSEDANGPANGRRQSGRSPNYPGISLRAAVERAQALYKVENRHAAPVRAVMAVWGYSNPSGGNAGVTLAALKKFGLIVDEKSAGQRVVRLSQLALEIILNPYNEDAIKQAALNPPLHREMWEKYGLDLPSDKNLRWQLIQRGFTEAGADEFIKEYRDTITFARLTKVPVTVEPDEDDDSEQAEAPPWTVTPVKVSGPVRRGWETATPEPTAPVHGMRMPFRLAGGEVVYLEGDFPISEAAFQNFLQILQVMKPGLVNPESTPRSSGMAERTGDQPRGHPTGLVAAFGRRLNDLGEPCVADC